VRSLYRQHVFPWVLELVMNQRVFRKLRREVLSPAAGRVLEIGFGTGINLPYYPGGISGIVGVDSNPGVSRLALRRAAEAQVEVEHHARCRSATPSSTRSSARSPCAASRTCSRRWPR